MKALSLISLLVAGYVSAWSQSTTGITGVRDTLYNIASEYNKHLKNYPDLKIVTEEKNNAVISQKDISFCQTKERELKLDLFYPKQKSVPRRTAIIFIHGGGWRSGNKKMHHSMAERLAALGYVCITPEYRLSTEALYPAAIHDIKSVIRWTRKNAKQLNIDTNKIVVAGHSAGGELAAFMGATNGMSFFEGNGCYTENSSRADAVIDLDGTLAFIHPESGEGDDSKKISAATYWFGYSKTENPAVWKQAAPLTHVGPHSPAVLFINSGVARMHAGREDFIKVLDQFSIHSEVKTFEGSPHTFLLFNPWFDSTVVIIDKFIKKIFTPSALKNIRKDKLGRQTIIVAQDGSGHYKKLQEALNAIPLNNKNPIVIRIKPGVYKEKLFLDSTKNHVQLIGDDKLKTILTYNDHTGKISPSGDTINTRTSWSFKIMADDFLASNITFQNDAGFNAGQAVAVESDGDRINFNDCRFIGNQDVLFLNSDKSRQYFQSCYIEGTTDFIFGSATAWFEKCEIYSKKNSHVTAASTPQSKEWGFVFSNCKLVGDTSLHNVSLGRPWRPYAAVVYMNCYIGSHIKQEGWSNWNNTDNYKTTRYAEYKNYGPSSDPSRRVDWARQLTDEEAKSYDLRKYQESWYAKKLSKF
ncbi:MAG TPA: pectinesterase family protein [Chitinophagaceae bacterium]